MNVVLLDKILNSLTRVARYLKEKNYVEANGGNISARLSRSRILIKRSGISFKDLIPKHLITVDLSEENPPHVSSDYLIHRYIYLKTDAKYIIHVHPSNLVSITYKLNELKPITYDSKVILGDAIPILNPHNHFDLIKLIDKKILAKGIIIEKGHGVYVFGSDIMKLVNLIEVLEHLSYITLKTI